MKSQKFFALFLTSVLVGCLLPPKEVSNPTKTPTSQPATPKDSSDSVAKAMELCATGRYSCWQDEKGRWVLDPIAPPTPASAPTVVAVVTPTSAPTITVQPTPTNKPDLKTPDSVQTAIADLQAADQELHGIDVQMYDLLTGSLAKGLPVLPGYDLVKSTSDFSSSSFDTGISGVSFKMCRNSGTLVGVKNAMGDEDWIAPYLTVDGNRVYTGAIFNNNKMYFCAPKTGNGQLKIRFYTESHGKAYYTGYCTFPIRVESSGNPGGSGDIKIDGFQIKKSGNCKWGGQE